MADRDVLLAALRPILDFISTLDPADPDARDKLAAQFPLSDLGELGALFEAGVADGWLCTREANGVTFSRPGKPTHPHTHGMSVDAVRMSGVGPGHTHPNGEFDLCFAVDGDPRFDGNPPGWTVYAPGTWHTPSVTGGTMNILYFLPEGAIRFEPRPA